MLELASNDGYLLQFFVERGIPVLGVEPAANVARAAEKKGIPTVVRFFGRETARELVGMGHSPDLILGNNVLAQVPDLNDFVGGIKMLLAPNGVVTMEFPHLLRTVDGERSSIPGLSRALLLLFTVFGRAHIRGARDARSSMSRSCRLTEVRSAFTPATAEDESKPDHQSAAWAPCAGGGSGD